MHIFHKWKVLIENKRWKLEECTKCGRRRWNENLLAATIIEKPLSKIKEII